MSNWLVHVLNAESGFEQALVRRYSDRLVALARRVLPTGVRRRTDPEDVVQSVYRSFFRRLTEGQFAFQDAHDVWRLLAAMTYRKAQNVTRFHRRECRDVRRERALDGCPEPELEPTASDVSLLFGCLEDLLASLPDRYRSIVVRRLQGESIEQIAQAVERSERTVLRVLAHLQELGAEQLQLET